MCVSGNNPPETFMIWICVALRCIMQTLCAYDSVVLFYKMSLE